MDSARDRKTGEIISGIDLWRIHPEKVDKQGYECYVCGVLLNPVSFRKGENKRTPHFKLLPDTEHRMGCIISKQENLKELAREESISTPVGFPLPYPSRLLLRADNKRPIGTRVVNLNGEEDDSFSETFNKTSRHPHHYTVDSIRPLAAQYLDFPFDRNLPLIVPGVDGNTYNSIFQRLDYQENYLFTERKIYFGTLHFQQTLTSTNYIEVRLTQGLWKNDRPVQQYRVRISTSGWTALEKECVCEEIDVAREEAKKASNERKQRKQRSYTSQNLPKPWFFFLGEPDSKDQFLLHANSSRLVCCVTAIFIWGNTPKMRMIGKLPETTKQDSPDDLKPTTLILSKINQDQLPETSKDIILPQALPTPKNETKISMPSRRDSTPGSHDPQNVLRQEFRQQTQNEYRSKTPRAYQKSSNERKSKPARKQTALTDPVATIKNALERLWGWFKNRS